MLLLSPFHSVYLTSVSPLFHHLVFHTARHIEAIDVHQCLSCRHGFVMRSPGSWLGGSRVSAPRLFCLAPPGHLVKFWPCAVVSRMTRSGLGTQAALSLRLIAAFGYTIPYCGVLFLFLGLPVFCFCFVRVFWLLVFFLGRCFLFPVMEWCHLYMHNEPSSLSQHWLHLQ